MNLAELINKLGVAPREDLLLRALTHSSYANEKWQDPLLSNERLEFLGDAVLNCATTAYLFNEHADLPEGDLSRLRAGLVCERSLAHAARRLELGKYLLLGAGEEATGGRERTSNLADAVEALIGAVYLTKGFSETRKFIEARILPLLLASQKGGRDFKTRLQELAQARGQRVDYQVVGEQGPDHAKEFTVEVAVDGRCLGTGRGRSKKRAEQDAARQAIDFLKTSQL